MTEMQSRVTPTIERLWEAIETRRDDLIALIAELVRTPSVLGEEAAVQAIVAEHLRGSGLAVESWDLSDDTLQQENAGNSGVPFANRPNVAGVRRGSGAAGGRSLILNGHVDVVSPEPLSAWTHDPWGAEIVGNRMYGRGALDMKSGVGIQLFLARLLHDLDITLKGDLTVQSVIEEECTGNGALDMARRYTADAAIVTEAAYPHWTKAHVGVMWFRVLVKGRSAHAAVAPTGVNAIVKMVPVIQALTALDARMNEERHPDFAHLDHPINLNIGVIQGGDWPSTVAGECELHCRLSFFPGVSVAAIREQVEAAVEGACEDDAWLTDNPPTVTYDGFSTAGSTVDLEDPVLSLLHDWHVHVTGSPLEEAVGTGVNDMRYFNFVGIPSTMYGAGGYGAHAVDEYLDLDTLVPIARSLGAYMLDFCGVADADPSA